MSRVLRQAATAPPTFIGDSTPRFVDQDLAAIVEEARQEAFEQGRQRGRREGHDEAHQAAERIDGALARAAEAARIAAVTTVREASMAAVDIAEFVLGGEAITQRGPMRSRVLAVLDQLDDAEVTVLLHPSDVAEFSEGANLPRGLRVQGDATLRPGEAKLEGRWSSVDMTRAAALGVVREALS